MSNLMRFRSGAVQLQKVRVDAETVIEAGDMVFLDTDDVKPASDFAWTTDLATTQGAFAGAFLGIAYQCSGEGETDPISIDVSPLSVYEYGVYSATYEVGAMLGPDSASSLLMDQQLKGVGSAGLAIARGAEYKASASGLLRVNFASAFFTGSGNVNSAIG